ncbi:MAG TPA: hypothetical protein VGB76_11970 [Pyrinomonadaceae bacterium]
MLRLTADDTEFARHDELTITVSGENQSPTVNADADQTITLPNTAALSGTTTDDGWPEGSPLTATWSVVSSPGTVAFNNPHQAATTASFGAAGNRQRRSNLDGDRHGQHACQRWPAGSLRPDPYAQRHLYAAACRHRRSQPDGDLVNRRGGGRPAAGSFQLTASNP